MKNQNLFVLIILFTTLSSHINVHAKEVTVDLDEISEEENRYEITDWLSLEATIELEQNREYQCSSNTAETKLDEFSKSFDVEFFIQASNMLKGGLTLEYDDENGGFLIDEAVAIIELDTTEITVGKTMLPFGNYSSNFISDSPVSFADTKGKGLIISHQFKENVELSIFGYKGDTSKANSASNSIDWGVTTEYSPNESWKIGAAYISDLADAEDIEFEENLYENRVAGISAYSHYDFNDFTFSTEFTSSLNSFQEFDEDRNRPKAWNIELAHKISERMEWALRYSGSKELEDKPFKQYGISGTWHINKKLSLSLEYLESDFNEGLAEGFQERSLLKSKTIAAQLGLSF